MMLPSSWLGDWQTLCIPIPVKRAKTLEEVDQKLQLLHTS